MDKHSCPATVIAWRGSGGGGGPTLFFGDGCFIPFTLLTNHRLFCRHRIDATGHKKKQGPPPPPAPATRHTRHLLHVQTISRCDLLNMAPGAKPAQGPTRGADRLGGESLPRTLRRNEYDTGAGARCGRTHGVQDDASLGTGVTTQRPKGAQRKASRFPRPTHVFCGFLQDMRAGKKKSRWPSSSVFPNHCDGCCPNSNINRIVVSAYRYIYKKRLYFLYIYRYGDTTIRFYLSRFPHPPLPRMQGSDLRRCRFWSHFTNLMRPASGK
jgi:hypothetical protein